MKASIPEQGMEKTLAGVDQLVIRRVPVVWYGLATDVRLVGDFDSWTEGFSLSPDEIQDQTFTKFSAEVPLRPVGPSQLFLCQSLEPRQKLAYINDVSLCARPNER